MVKLSIVLAAALGPAFAAGVHAQELPDGPAKGMVEGVCSGRLGRFDPRAGEAKEWPSPSGPKSHPYAIAVVDGIVRPMRPTRDGKLLIHQSSTNRILPVTPLNAVATR